MVTIEEDELAREDDETALRIAMEGLEATVEQLGELAGERGGGGVGETTGRVEGDAGLGGVGDDETDLWLFGQRHEGVVLGVGVEGTADDVDTLEKIDGLASLTSLEVDMIETILRVEAFGRATRSGGDDDDGGVEGGLLVHVPDDPVDKATKEVAFAELDDFFGCYTFGSGQSA